MARYHGFWILILDIVHLCYAGDINCANFQDANCFRKTINCVPDGKDCIVTCNANNACKDSIINCAPMVGCSVHCLKLQSCQNIVINGGSAITLSINTGNTAQQTLIDGQINCQNVAYCDVTCTEKRYQCRNIQIKAENAGQLILRCEGNNQHTYHCQGLNIFCPKTQPKCWIFSPVALAQVNIYSQLGFDGVAICGDSNSNSIGNMHCGSQYHTTCPIPAFSVNYCDAPSVCDATNVFTECNPPPPTTSNPTLRTKKTAIPTSIPTTNPSSNPTFNPTSIPTSIPTFIPSFNPTALPTNQPTIIPTSDFILTSYPSFEEIRIVNKTVMISARKPARHMPTFFSVAGFAAILSFLVLVCTNVICIFRWVYSKMCNKSNITHSNDNKVNVNELQQLAIPANNELILCSSSESNEGNGQYIAKMNSDDEKQDCNEKYEGHNTTQTKSETYEHTYQNEMIQTDKQALSVLLSSVTPLQDENIIGGLSDDENMGLYGPGSGNHKTHGNKHTN